MRRKTTLPNRGESIVVSYVLVLGIMTVLSALLISASGGFLDTKNEEVTRTQAQITTEAIASELEEVDKNARRIDGNSSASGFYMYESEADELIGQYPYKVSLESHPDPDTYTVKIEIQTVGITETSNVTLYTIKNVSTNTVSSGSSLTYVYQTGGVLALGDETLNVSQFDINVSGDYTISSDTEFDAGIKTRNGGDIYQGANSIIYGSVVSDGRIDTSDDLLVFGNVTADNTINFDAGTTITRTVTAGGSIQTQENTTIGGSIDSGGSVGVGRESIVSEDITAVTDVELAQQSKVKGDITTGDSVVLNDQSQVNGTIDANQVTLYDNTQVTGDVIVPTGSNLVCSGTGSTINGQSCSDYKSANY